MEGEIPPVKNGGTKEGDYEKRSDENEKGPRTAGACMKDGATKMKKAPAQREPVSGSSH
jgi:hypothetical protein